MKDQPVKPMPDTVVDPAILHGSTREGTADNQLKTATSSQEIVQAETATQASSDFKPAVSPLPLRRSEILSIPGYENFTELGIGGMGVVYRARHIMLQRDVAVKMIKSGEFAGQHELQRFLHEARIIARLRHPNIVQVYEAGISNNSPYLVLEYMEGGSLAKQLRHRQWTIPEAVALVEKLALGMQCAHKEGVIHRDLKPDNVLLTPEGEPKIADFGLAKHDQSGQTQTGVALGTPSYMAPEQAAGKTRDVGPAADIYAMGVILYELMTGQPPHVGESPLDTLQKVLHDPVEPPSQRNPAVPAELDAICMTALAKQPEKRFASAQSLAEALDDVRAQHFPPKRKSGSLPSVVVQRKSPIAWKPLVSIAAIVAILAVLGWYGWNYPFQNNNQTLSVPSSDKLPDPTVPATPPAVPTITANHLKLPMVEPHVMAWLDRQVTSLDLAQNKKSYLFRLGNGDEVLIRLQLDAGRKIYFDSMLYRVRADRTFEFIAGPQTRIVLRQDKLVDGEYGRFSMEGPLADLIMEHNALGSFRTENGKTKITLHVGHSPEMAKTNRLLGEASGELQVKQFSPLTSISVQQPELIRGDFQLLFQSEKPPELRVPNLRVALNFAEIRSSWLANFKEGKTFSDIDIEAKLPADLKPTLIPMLRVFGVRHVRFSQMHITKVDDLAVTVLPPHTFFFEGKLTLQGMIDKESFGSKVVNKDVKADTATAGLPAAVIRQASKTTDWHRDPTVPFAINADFALKLSGEFFWPVDVNKRFILKLEIPKLIAEPAAENSQSALVAKVMESGAKVLPKLLTDGLVFPLSNESINADLNTVRDLKVQLDQKDGYYIWEAAVVAVFTK
ncbi:MAG: serine/threonine protein kinase [Planctomycetia bacterium]|nr:serine/threonine protein kinase [Planctomycetia bacterium]